MIKIVPSGDYVQLKYVDTISEYVQEELKSDSDAIEYSSGSNGKIYLKFGRMTFEYFDPTEFEIDGSGVTDAADFVTKLTALFSSSSGGESYDPSSFDDADALDGTEILGIVQGGDNKKVTINDLLPVQLQEDRTIDLNGHILDLIQGDDSFLTLDPTINNETVRIGAKNITGDGNEAAIRGGVTDATAEARLRAAFNGSERVALIDANANATSSSIVHTADTHTFNGNAFVIATGRITSVIVNTGGTNYQVNDQLTVDSGHHNAILNVDSVDINGAITGVSIVNPGDGYNNDNGTPVTGGSGDNNATVDIIGGIGISTNNLNFYKLGEATSGAPTPDSKIHVTINGVDYDIAAEEV